MFKLKKAVEPRILTDRIPPLERAARFVEIISNPEDYLRSLHLIVQTLRPTLFGRDVKIEYWDAGRATSIFQEVTMGKARVRFQWTLKPVGKGTIQYVHGVLGDWYIGRKDIGPICMTKRDTFHPNWTFSLSEDR